MQLSRESVQCEAVLQQLLSEPHVAAVTWDPQRSQLVVRFRPTADREALRATAVRAAEVLRQHQDEIRTHPCPCCDNGRQSVDVANGVGSPEDLLTLVVPVRRSAHTPTPAEEERVLWWRQHGLLLSTAATALLLLAAWLADRTGLPHWLAIALYAAAYVAGGAYASYRALLALGQRTVDIDL